MLASVPLLCAPSPHARAHAHTLVTYCPGDAPQGHDRESRVNVARRLARVMGWRYGGALDSCRAYAEPLYVVPHDALLASEAAALGIHGPGQLFGGVVPHAFVATKAITHPLISPGAAAPEGWSHACAERIGPLALRGYTTFAREDALTAARLLLREGPVRLKCVTGIGGAGQHLAHDETGLRAALGALAPKDFTSGVTVEEHLANALTFSVGVARCAEASIAYCGTQSVAANHRGHAVYGGSVLDAVRGGFGALLASDLTRAQRAAAELASAYDETAFSAYPGAFASRRNYDVLFGRDASGRTRAGVLEQSWRIGGASGAEVVALEAFRRDPTRTRVRCAAVEVYDDACAVPEGAFVYYRGVDAHAGALTKYAVDLDAENA